MADIHITGYLESLEWMQSLCKSLGWETQLVTKENYQEIVNGGMADWFEEGEDDKEDVIGTRIIPIIRPILQIGKRSFEVQSLYLNTEHNWCCWKVAMVSINEPGKSWHSLDCRILMEKPNKPE